MKPDYHEGPEARKRFEEGMAELFRAPKTEVKKEEVTPKPKRKKPIKD